jgi:uncharacterized protein
MLPSLAALISLQGLDTAADAARRRVGELPAAEQAIDAHVAAATAAVGAAKTKWDESQHARRTLEKDVAGVDTRLARFDDHKAAVKTNQEYTALLHEIATAKGEKDAIEERILLLMEQADAFAADLKAAESALAQAKKDADAGKRALAQEKVALDAELARLAAERQDAAARVDKALLGKYEQLLKQRRGIAVVRMSAELCTACHVRQRPHVVQQIRRNDSIVQCESCQRILYYEPPRTPEGSEPGERSEATGVPASEPVRGSGGTKSPG